MKLVSLFYAQARIRKFAAKAACGPRGEQGKIHLPCSIVHEPQRKIAGRAGGARHGGQGKD